LHLKLTSHFPRRKQTPRIWPVGIGGPTEFCHPSSITTLPTSYAPVSSDATHAVTVAASSAQVPMAGLVPNLQPLGQGELPLDAAVMGIPSLHPECFDRTNLILGLGSRRDH
jgi:hypothetical protein